jgi:hypothetical protein
MRYVAWHNKASPSGEYKKDSGWKERRGNLEAIQPKTLKTEIRIRK